MVTESEQVRIVMAETVVVPSADMPTAKPDGPLAAALLAAGIGAFSLGLFTTLAEASAGFQQLLNMNAGVGPLSGKTIGATAIFVISWIVLFYALRYRDGILRSATIAFVVLTALGVLGTFPLFFQAFAGE